MTTPSARLASPRPRLPDGIEAGEAVGSYGGPVSPYTRRLLSGLSTLYPSGRLTSSIIAKMRRHYQVSACLLVQTLPLVRADWGIECEDEDVAAFLTSAYERIAFDVHRSAARALWAGYSPNTLVLDVDTNLGGLVWTEIRDLDPSTCRPLVDDLGTLAGLVQNEGQVNEVTVEEPVTLWIAEGMESGNLYGRSLLDAALDPWQDYAAIRAFHARYLERFGEPVVKVRAPAGQSVSNTAEIAAAAAETPPRTVAAVIEDNLDVAQAIGENLRHHSVVALPAELLFGGDGKPAGFGWDVDYLEATRSGGDEFLKALDHKNRAIARAMFVPDLLFTNTDTGAFALGQSHRTVWSASVEGRLDDYSRQISAQLLDRLRLYNFGERAPHARLVFAPPSAEDRDQLWSLAETLVEGGRLPVDVERLGERLGIELLPPEETGSQSVPFQTVGLPALVEAGIITEQDARELIGVPGTAPGKPAPAAPVLRAALAGDPGAREVVRRELGLGAGGLARAVPAAELASGSSVDGLPEWKLPQSFDPPPYARDMTARERRVAFSRIESGMNTAEAETIAQLVTILERDRERVLRQLNGVMGKGTAAEILDGLGTIELRGSEAAAKAWRDLMRAVAAIGLETLRTELAAYADAIPTTLGASTEALVRSYATSSAERVFSALTTEVRFQLLNAYTSGVAPAGLSSVVGDVFAEYEASEGRAVRLTSRMLSSKALNVSRRDGIERGGVPLRGAQYSALLDRRTCDLCRRLDETVIPVTHTDLARFTPPVHHNCRCVWVWITTDEADFAPTWETPPSSLVDRFGGLVF